MYGPTNRFIRSTLVVSCISVAASGCQSVSHPKFAWAFPPAREEVEERPVITIDERAMPPLPLGYERWVDVRKADSATMPDGAGSITSQSGPAKLDNALTRASATATFDPAGADMPASVSPIASISQTGSLNGPASVREGLSNSSLNVPAPKGLSSVQPVSAVANAADSVRPEMAGNGIAALPVPEALPPPAPVALDPRTTQQVVKKLVGASDDLLRAGFETSNEEEETVQVVQADASRLKAIAAPDISRTSGSIPATVPLTVSAKSVNRGIASDRPARPPLETLADEPADSTRTNSEVARSHELAIPKVAICRAVEGRGRFQALPASLRTPGARMIVYWELDGLRGEGPAPTGTAFTAVVELISTERDEILASFRETIRDSGVAPAEGDFAALRWTIPSELPMGDYRVQVTVSEETTKRTATAQADLTLGRGPVASRFVLP